MSALQILKAHYEGKTIVGGTLPQYLIGWKIIHVNVHDYEPMMEFVISKNDNTDTVDILFEWDIEVSA
jgi:hypothetical protein